jgi:crotonobetainyl-CoA:carnitine CoA-transferase CaiB-like acyl-CoA transferase
MTTLGRDGTEIPVIEHPLNFENAESGFDEAPPMLGEDTESVLRDVGYTDEDIEMLRTAGAIPEE